jgi:hypothetical protein
MRATAAHGEAIGEWMIEWGGLCSIVRAPDGI